MSLESEYAAWSVSKSEARQIGKRLGVDWTRFPFKEFRKGIEVEFEHTSDIIEAARIALDHLVENAHYYSKLEQIERTGMLTKAQVKRVRTVQAALQKIAIKPKVQSQDEELNEHIRLDDALEAAFRKHRVTIEPDGGLGVNKYGPVAIRESRNKKIMAVMRDPELRATVEPQIKALADFFARVGTAASVQIQYAGNGRDMEDEPLKLYKGRGAPRNHQWRKGPGFL